MKEIATESLAEMLEKYRTSDHSSDKYLARLFGISPDVFCEIRSGEFEKRVRRVASEARAGKIQHIVSRQVAGTVARLIRGCGQDESAWLIRLGFPGHVRPAGKKVGRALKKDDLTFLLEIVEIAGELSLQAALEMLESKDRRSSGQ